MCAFAGIPGAAASTAPAGSNYALRLALCDGFVRYLLAAAHDRWFCTAIVNTAAVGAHQKAPAW